MSELQELLLEHLDELPATLLLRILRETMPYESGVQLRTAGRGEDDRQAVRSRTGPDVEPEGGACAGPHAGGVGHG